VRPGRPPPKGWSLRRKGLVALVIPMMAFALAAITQLLINAIAMDSAEGVWLRVAAFVALIAGMGIGGLALVRYVSDISRRLRLLQRDALTLARGQPISDVLPGDDEIAELSRALARASSLLTERELELRDATWAAERANQSKTIFLSRMSHELRTPLNAMLGFAQLLSTDDLTDAQRDDVEQILRGGRHLLELINDVLDVSRIEAGELTLSVESVGLPDVVSEAVSLLTPAALTRGITIEDGTGGVPLVVWADRQRLLQVVLNLLSNAIKYNEDGGSVRLDAQVEEVRSALDDQPTELVCLAVRDTGPGIPADKRARLFVPFERLGAEHTSVDGVGIGLALSRQLAHQMRGELDVSSEVGEGSTFRLTLPRARLEEGHAIMLDSRPGIPVVDVTDDRSARPTSTAVRRAAADEVVVLCIDDNPINARVIEVAVARLPGHRVMTALQGRTGLELAQAQRPALVLLDLHLPDLHGLEVLAELKAVPATAEMPVVIVSADATAAAARQAAELGAAGYLTKPIDVSLLLDWVARLTSPPGIDAQTAS